MKLRYLVFMLASLIAAEIAAAQTSNGASAGREQYRLSGVLVSDTRRTALVDGHLIHEGMQIGGAIIEAVENRQIRVRIGSSTQIVRVGGSFTAGSSRDEDSPMVVVTRSAQAAEHQAGQLAKVDERTVTDPHGRGHMIVTRFSPESRARRLAPGEHIELAVSGSETEHAVLSGETLSGIALRYRPDGITINQMMVSLFDKNPDAFDGNLNALKAGATLTIPDASTITDLSPRNAMAEVMRHHENWREGTALTPVQMAASSRGTETAIGSAVDKYGPVRQGDTLSEIARHLGASRDGVTANQLMIALYRNNPNAFGRNIDVLYEGAVLALPDEAMIGSVSPDAATAEVLRQRPQELGKGMATPDFVSGFDMNTIVSADDSAVLGERR